MGGVKAQARFLRTNLTDAERVLWGCLRLHQMGGFKFRRQAPIGPYIVDFVCFEAKLVIEVDGGQHLRRKNYDSRRTDWLRGQGFEVLRFWDHEVLKSIEDVKNRIWARLIPLPKSSPTGGEEKD